MRKLAYIRDSKPGRRLSHGGYISRGHWGTSQSISGLYLRILRLTAEKAITDRVGAPSDACDLRRPFPSRALGAAGWPSIGPLISGLRGSGARSLRSAPPLVPGADDTPDVSLADLRQLFGVMGVAAVPIEPIAFPLHLAHPTCTPSAAVSQWPACAVTHVTWRSITGCVPSTSLVTSPRT